MPGSSNAVLIQMSPMMCKALEAKLKALRAEREKIMTPPEAPVFTRKATKGSALAAEQSKIIEKYNGDLRAWKLAQKNRNPRLLNRTSVAKMLLEQALGT